MGKISFWGFPGMGRFQEWEWFQRYYCSNIHPKSEQIGCDLLLSTEKWAEKVRILGRQTFAEKVRILGRQTFATKVRLSCVLSLKFGGKSQKNGGDISPASPAFRMYVFKPNISGPRMPKVILLETNSKGDYFVHQSWLIVVLWALFATQGNAFGNARQRVSNLRNIYHQSGCVVLWGVHVHLFCQVISKDIFKEWTPCL